MSLFTDGQTKLFPLEWIKECIAIYTESHGKAPKVLVLAQEDYIDYNINRSIAQAGQLCVKVIYGEYLKTGEIDLAMGIKDE